MMGVLLAAMVAGVAAAPAPTTTRTEAGPRLVRRGGCLSGLFGAEVEAQAALPKGKTASRGNVTWVKLPDSETTLLLLQIQDGRWTITNDTAYPVKFFVRQQPDLLQHPHSPHSSSSSDSKPQSLSLTLKPEGFIRTQLPGDIPLLVDVLAWNSRSNPPYHT